MSPGLVRSRRVENQGKEEKNMQIIESPYDSFRTSVLGL